MSKYIRTEDGISSVEPYTTPKGRTLYAVSGCENLISKDSLEEITIKEADTIEELCDEFVIVNGKIHQTTKAFNKIIEYFNPYDTFYGAIWTDKGLIYVAKMNNERELVLI